MTVSPLPLRGGVHVDPSDPSRALRVSAHPETGSVTVSLWRDNRCVATHHLASADVPELIRMLAASLVPASRDGRATGS